MTNAFAENLQRKWVRLHATDADAFAVLAGSVDALLDDAFDGSTTDSLIGWPGRWIFAIPPCVGSMSANSV
jgi:hypothetical protein